jgi:hypothetical protein
MGAGRHVVRFDESARLSSGLYLVRLTQGGRAYTSKALVAR